MEMWFATNYLSYVIVQVLLCLFPLLTSLQFASSFFMVSVVWFVYLLFVFPLGEVWICDMSQYPINIVRERRLVVII